MSRVLLILWLLTLPATSFAAAAHLDGNGLLGTDLSLTLDAALDPGDDTLALDTDANPFADATDADEEEAPETFQQNWEDHVLHPEHGERLLDPPVGQARFEATEQRYTGHIREVHVPPPNRLIA